jgi:hypothetical protein
MKMDKQQVLKTIIEAISLIEKDPQKYLTDYSICEALYQARDYIMQKND